MSQLQTSSSLECQQLVSTSPIKEQPLTRTISEDDENEDKKNKQMAKQIKKHIKKEKKIVQREQDQVYRILIAKDIAARGVQLYINICALKKIFTIQGDYFVNLDYDKKSTSIEDQINQFNSMKQVLSATQDNKRGIIYLDIITNDQIEYSSLDVIKEAIFKRQDPLLQEFYPLLCQYFEQMSLNNKMQSKLNSIMSQSAQEILEEKRRLYFEERIKEFTETHFTDTDFYIYYKYQQRKINDPYLQYRQVGISYPLIALLGTDPVSFTNICMRKGFLEFSSNRNKQLQIIHSMTCRLQLQNDMTHICKSVEDLVLLTFDEYEIHTKMLVTCFKFNYPPELQIVLDGYRFIHEIPVFLHYQIDENTISYLLAKRSKNPQFQQQWENEEFGYTLESQVFLEKYYNEIVKNVLPSKEQRYQHQLKYYYNKECNIKAICNENNISPNSCQQHYKSLFS